MIVRKNTLAIGFATLAVFFPSIFTYLGYGNIVSLYINCVALLGIVLWIESKLPFDEWTLCFTVFIGVLGIITFLNENPVSTIVGPYIRLIAFIVIIWMGMRKDSEGTLRAVKNVLGVLVLFNFITLIVAPNGLFQLHREVSAWYEYDVSIWLFGNKNAMMNWLIPANFLAQIDYAMFQRKNRWNIIVIATTVLTAVLAKSSTTLITIGIMSLVFVFGRRMELLFSKIKTKMIIVLYLLLQLLLFTTNELGIFQIVAAAFGKDASFTGRTTAWSEGIKLILVNPIIGYGHITEEKARSLLGAYAFVNAHNTLLNTVIIGGVIAGVLYLILIWKSTKKIDFIKNTTVAAILKVTVVGMLLQASFEAYTETVTFWVVFLLIYLIAKISLMEDRSYSEW